MLSVSDSSIFGALTVKEAVFVVRVCESAQFSSFKQNKFDNSFLQLPHPHSGANSLHYSAPVISFIILRKCH